MCHLSRNSRSLRTCTGIAFLPVNALSGRELLVFIGRNRIKILLMSLQMVKINTCVFYRNNKADNLNQAFCLNCRCYLIDGDVNTGRVQ
jgi:hypothetical protein